MKYLVCASYVRDDTNVKDFSFVTESPEEVLQELHAKYITSSYDMIKDIYIVPVNLTHSFETFNNYQTAVEEIRTECDKAKWVGVNINESN